MSPLAPNAELAAALRALPSAYTVEAIDRVWIFPPQQGRERETGLAVLALFDAQTERRRVVTLQYQVGTGRSRAPRQDAWAEHGACPPERVDRLIDGVLRRLGAAAQPAEPVDVAGAAPAWSALLAALEARAG